MKRRGFLGAIGAALATPISAITPVAAGDAALLNIVSSGLGGTNGMSLPVSSGSWSIERLAKINAFRAMFPEKHHALMVARNRTVYAIDHSILALRSTSLAAKIQMQRDKQIREAAENEVSILKVDILSDEVFR